MYSPRKAVILSIISVLLLSFIRRDTRLSWDKIKKIIKMFSRGILTVGIACAAAGIVVGTLGLTGASLRLTYAFVEVAGDNLFILLCLSAILCIILGMGLPTVAAYSVAASFAAPALVNMGVDKLPAHLFVFYYAIISSLTPPVAIAAYASSAIANSNPMKTAVLSSKLAFAGFVVPFMIVYQELLLGYGIFNWVKMINIITGFVSIWFLAIAIINYHVFGNINIYERIIYFICAPLLLVSNLYLNVIGILVGGVMIFYNYYKNIIIPRKKNTNQYNPKRRIF